MWELIQQTGTVPMLILCLAAFLIGINKTAVPGIGLLPVILLASTFETRLSTGLQLGMLALADIMAVAWYHRHADWKILLKLLPWALAGLAVGSAILRFIPLDDTQTMNIIIGVIVIALVIFSFIRRRLDPDSIPSGTKAAACYGILLGTTTQLANAAGPVSALYLLAMKLPKEKYMGTGAWFFLIVNWIKVPIFAFEGRVTLESVKLDLLMLPVIILGAAVGILLLKKMPQKLFNDIVMGLAVIGALKLLFF